MTARQTVQHPLTAEEEMKPLKLTSVLVGVITMVGLTLGPAWGAVESEQGGAVPPDMSTDASAIPHEYSVPPVNPKSLKPSDNHPFMNKTVKSPKGETLGTIHHVMVDTEKGKETYAMLYLAGKKDQYVPVPINFLRESETGLILNATKEKLEKGPNFGGRGSSSDFEHMGGEPLKPNLRGGGG
jgi:hypothetical protein